jgi:hypothetical protein
MSDGRPDHRSCQSCVVSESLGAALFFVSRIGLTPPKKCLPYRPTKDDRAKVVNTQGYVLALHPLCRAPLY